MIIFMTQQYGGSMTKERYGWVAQLVEQSSGTRRSEIGFLVESFSFALTGQMSVIKHSHPSQTLSI